MIQTPEGRRPDTRWNKSGLSDEPLISLKLYDIFYDRQIQVMERQYQCLLRIVTVFVTIHWWYSITCATFALNSVLEKFTWNLENDLLIGSLSSTESLLDGLRSSDLTGVITGLLATCNSSSCRARASFGICSQLISFIGFARNSNYDGLLPYHARRHYFDETSYDLRTLVFSARYAGERSSKRLC